MNLKRKDPKAIKDKFFILLWGLLLADYTTCFQVIKKVVGVGRPNQPYTAYLSRTSVLRARQRPAKINHRAVRRPLREHGTVGFWIVKFWIHITLLMMHYWIFEWCTTFYSFLYYLSFTTFICEFVLSLLLILISHNSRSTPHIKLPLSKLFYFDSS